MGFVGALTVSFSQMIVVRSNESSKYPKVYAVNTFFYPKIAESGHSAVRRWTRKVKF